MMIIIRFKVAAARCSKDLLCCAAAVLFAAHGDAPCEAPHAAGWTLPGQ
jgi:hypothetical protein